MYLLESVTTLQTAYTLVDSEVESVTKPAQNRYKASGKGYKLVGGEECLAVLPFWRVWAIRKLPLRGAPQLKTKERDEHSQKPRGQTQRTSWRQDEGNAVGKERTQSNPACARCCFDETLFHLANVVAAERCGSATPRHLRPA